MKQLKNSRLSLLYSFIVIYIAISFSIRLYLFVATASLINLSFLTIVSVFGKGFLFDVSVALFFSLAYSLYLVAFPSRWIGTLLDKIVTGFIVGLSSFIMLFSFMAEFPFWEEFNTRFNFIAVDYLIYTYEVVENINESYPIPLIVIALLVVLAGLFLLLKKRHVFYHTFHSKPHFFNRIITLLPFWIAMVLSILFLKNEFAETSNNLYQNELSKNGVFSFFHAYRANELDYDTFYAKFPESEAYQILKSNLSQQNQTFTTQINDDISRVTKGNNEQTPNIVLITIESLSADFLGIFGNQDHLTPNLDSLSQNAILFDNLYATGTRTVRGMEALTLSVPPTPGNSIVRRPNNQNLYSIATVLKQKNYQLNFIYGGDGYFDNMNSFFGGQGFDIIDRNRGNPLSDNIKTKRYSIVDKEVTFENAWGVCDGDIYRQSLKYATLQSQNQQPFFQFIMTTSNHRPYSFPEGKINFPQGKRNSAVAYTDYALGEFIKEAKTKPWFKNTVFVIVADHCARSAGKWEINIDKHHIPAMIYNLPQPPEKINRLVSQIDLMPTLFGYLGWNYTSEFYGKDIRQTSENQDCAFIANYRTLGRLKKGVFTQLDDKKGVKQFLWNATDKQMLESEGIINSTQKKETIAAYQTASERFKNGKMKVENNKN